MMKLITLEESKVKGSALKNLKGFIDQFHEPKFFQDHFMSLMQENKGVILPSKWYNADSMMEISMQAAKAMNLDFKEFCLRLNEYNLRQDLNGVYRFFLKMGGVQRVLKSMPQITKTYTNFGLWEIITNTPGHHEALMSSPSKLSQWNAFMAEGAVRGILNELNTNLEMLEVRKKNTFQKGNQKYVSYQIVIKYEN